MIRSMLEPLNQTAARVPDRVAFYDDREQMTYAQLRRAARSIGTALTTLARPGQAVALLLDPRSIQNIPALYGALYAGCAYAPMDISMPPERLRQLLGLLEPAAVIVDEKGGKALDAAGWRGAPTLSYREALETADDEEKLAAIEKTIGPDAPMSILYTSGSTGVPKGSVQTHGSYIQWTDATIRMYGLGEDTVFGNQSPFFYANSILDIFPPVALGARVYLLPAGCSPFPES
ncbi:MAG: AMP-binding protein [Clostridia bacterium]|nr:AMP-binding protein [Clostridia bacterium]